MSKLHNLSVIEFKGNDARQFLHNQLSADILKIDEGETGFACCCNPAGRVLGLFLLRPEVGRVLGICSTSLAPELVNWLSRFVFRDDVKIRLADELSVLAPDKTATENNAIWRNCTGLDYRVVENHGEFLPASDRLISRSKAAGLVRGLCWLEPETSARFLPQMLGFEKIGALSFNKGCYPGQEVIARTRYLGKLKRRVALVRVDAAIEPELMSKVVLGETGQSWSAVIVDWAALEDDSTIIFTVARKDDESEVQWIEIEENKIPVLAD